MDGDRGAVVALADSVTILPGVGERRAGDLGKLGIREAGDLLTLWPRRHLDRSEVTPLWQIQAGQRYTVQGMVKEVRREVPGGRRPNLRVIIDDGSGRLQAVFFHAQWLTRQFSPGRRVLFTGKVDLFGRTLSMTHPDFEFLDADEKPQVGLVPVYPLAGALRQRFMRQLMQKWIPRLAPQAPEPLPDWLCRREELPPRSWAVLHLHFPQTPEDREQARRRLVFDEFLRMSLAVHLLHGAGEVRRGRRQAPDSPLCREFLARLPFSLTPGQAKAWAEIREDLASDRPMARLLQGDVGSGKTVLAALTMLAAVGAGRQAAFMAPTELLAEQVWAVLKKFFEPVGVEVGLLTGRAKDAGQVRTRLAEGSLAAVVGTQALVSDAVNFRDLGVVVVDEQHRFGVRQRARLGEKGLFPDMLVMTATPIPRTLALTVYGDLDVSRIEGLPPGRQPITTVHLPLSRRREAYQAVMDAVRYGRQAYVVCPLVEESEEREARAATVLAEGMKKVSGWRIGLLHGQMRTEQKAEVMEAFRSGGLDVLVTTTIVEVGVDVPNASVMVVEEADRFGMAQLHQLRGRIGRGGHASVCYLLADPKTEESQARLDALVETTDGLVLAERDLEIRGPGEVLGMRQHGVAGFELANPLKDLALLERAREIAREILRQDPGLLSPAHAGMKLWVGEAIAAALPGQVLH